MWTSVGSTRRLGFLLSLVVILILAVATSVAASSYQQSQPIATVVAKGLNVRSGPGTNYARIGGVKQGDQLAVLGQNNNCAWLLVRTPQNLEGWVAGSPTYVTLPVACSTIPPATPVATVIATATKPPSGTPTPSSTILLYDGKLGARLELNIDNEKHEHGWIKDVEGTLRADFLAGQKWAVIYITVGPPQPEAERRQSINLSACHTLSVDLRAGQGNVTVNVGMKDTKDPDDGSETQIPLALTTAWQSYQVPLAKFVSAELRQIYLPFEVVYTGSTAVSVFLDNVRILCQ
ncbi:MAG: SH3 domain-containing protein [Caldilinea sp. CFX5]|nr:SH3 domain-containing protein [Caldilinea sp. CFX5]